MMSDLIFIDCFKVFAATASVNFSYSIFSVSGIAGVSSIKESQEKEVDSGLNEIVPSSDVCSKRVEYSILPSTLEIGNFN